MDEYLKEGSLLESPLPQVLYRLWQQKKTGCLALHREGETRRLRLLKGLLALDESELDEQAFLKHIVQKGLLTQALQRQCRAQARSRDCPLLKALSETGRLDPTRLWRELELHFQQSLTALFEWPDGRYEFSPANTADFNLLLAGISTPDALLAAIRGMKRLEAVNGWLGREPGAWQAYFSAHLSPASLEPHERYVLSLMTEEKSLEDIYSLSHMAKPETQKVLFALGCTGIAGPALPRSRVKTPSDFSFAEYDKILAAFRDKAAVIFRYISKEVGPVATNIMSKGLEEVNSWLGPAFPRLTLNPDGCPELKPLLRVHRGLFREDDAKNLSRILDEILAAEVLMVKRTLGNEHEAALVKALER